MWVWDIGLKFHLATYIILLCCKLKIMHNLSKIIIKQCLFHSRDTVTEKSQILGKNVQMCMFGTIPRARYSNIHYLHNIIINKELLIIKVALTKNCFLETFSELTSSFFNLGWWTDEKTREHEA